MSTPIHYPPVVAVAVAANPVLSADATDPIDSSTAAPADGKCWYFGGLCVTYSVAPAASSPVEVYVRNEADDGDDFLLFRTATAVAGPVSVYLLRALAAPAGRKLRFSAAADATATIDLIVDCWQGSP